MKTDEDRDLKAAFKAFASRTRAAAPSFHELTSGDALDAARGRRRRRRMAMLAAVVMIPAFFALSIRPERALDYERFTALTGLDLNEVTWEAPSDFLLDFTGRELLRRVLLIEDEAAAPAPDSVRSPDSIDTSRRPRS